MFLRKTMNNPRLLMQVGSMSLLIASLCKFTLHPATRFWQGFADGFTGFAYGAAIGLMLLSIRLNARRKAGVTDIPCA